MSDGTTQTEREAIVQAFHTGQRLRGRKIDWCHLLWLTARRMDRMMDGGALAYCMSDAECARFMLLDDEQAAAHLIAEGVDEWDHHDACHREPGHDGVWRA